MLSAVLVDGVASKSSLTVLVVDRTSFIIYNIYTPYSYIKCFIFYCLPFVFDVSQRLSFCMER